MKSSFSVRRILPVAGLVFLIALTVLVYLPGLKGGFLFDDHPNLGELANYGGVVDYPTFKAFVFNGISSTLGRPLSLATFLLDSNTWPADPFPFKLTNLKVHLLVGVLLCWATINLMRLIGRNDVDSAWIGLLSSGIWLLHPYMVSTTLYIVQRMAQLSAVFMLAGLTAYLHGRVLQTRGHIWAGYMWMSCSLAIATPLAILSKENGILLPLLVLMIEFCLAEKIAPLALLWKIAFLIIPSLVVAWLLLKAINFSKDAWPTRVFTQPERLLTEPRIIWEYLYHLWVPHVEGRGLYQDGYNFSRGLFQPISTIFSLLGLSLLVLLAILSRFKYPLISIGVLFYLAGHLLESSTIALELYFEHRNYLPSAFLFLPLAALIVGLKDKYSPSLSFVIAGLILGVLSLFTWQRATLWSNTETLQFYWAASTPESPRAQAKIVTRLMSLGRTEEGVRRMENAAKLLPHSSLLAVSLLIIKVHTETATVEDFQKTQNVMRNQAFDAQSVAGLRNLVADIVSPRKLDLYGYHCLELISTLQKSPKYNKVPAFKRIAPYLKANIFLAQNKFDLALEEYKKAIPLHHEADAALAMVAEIARAGRLVDALVLLDVAQANYEKQKDRKLIGLGRPLEFEFEDLRSRINADIAQSISDK